MFRARLRWVNGNCTDEAALSCLEDFIRYPFITVTIRNIIREKRTADNFHWKNHVISRKDEP